MIVKMALGVTSEMDNAFALLAGLEFYVMIVSNNKISEAFNLLLPCIGIRESYDVRNAYRGQSSLHPCRKIGQCYRIYIVSIP